MSDLEDTLALWRDRVAIISSNINELNTRESTKRVRIRARQGQYSGDTRKRAELAISLLGTLSDDYLLLANAVATAGDALHGGFFLTREGRSERLNSLLGPGSIARPNGAVPLENRTLLGSANGVERLSPQQLLERMEAAFASARDDLREIDDAEQANKTAVADLRQEYERLEALSIALGVTTSDRPSFIQLQGLESDPLAAAAGIDATRRALDTWARLIGDAQKAKEEAAAGISKAGGMLGELRGLSESFDAERGKVEAMLGPALAAELTVVPSDTVRTLSSWFESLSGSLTEGHWSAVNVGLSRFETALRDAITAARKAVAGARAKTDELDDLRGRFTALKAKESAVTLQTGKAPDTAAIRGEITEALAARPVNLQAATDRMRQYQTLLSGQLH